MGIWGAVGKVEGKVIAGVDRGDHEWLSQSRLAALKASALILDGEVCVFDKQLVSQFHLLGGPEPEESCTSRCSWRLIVCTSTALTFAACRRVGVATRRGRRLLWCGTVEWGLGLETQIEPAVRVSQSLTGRRRHHVSSLLIARPHRCDQHSMFSRRNTHAAMVNIFIDGGLTDLLCGQAFKGHFCVIGTARRGARSRSW
jgi:hypothetical protein